MTTQYRVDPIVKGLNGFGINFSDTIYTATLTAATDTSIAVPKTAAMGTPCAATNNKFLAVFSYSSGSNVYVALNGTAAVPAGASFAASTSELNPTAKIVQAGDVIHMISAATPSISVAFYAIQE